MVSYTGVGRLRRHNYINIRIEIKVLIDINMRTLSPFVRYMFKRHDVLYNDLKNRVSPNDFPKILDIMNVGNFARVMAHMTLVYVMHASEDTTRRAVRLVAAPLKSFDLSAYRIEESFFRRVISRIWS